MEPTTLEQVEAFEMCQHKRDTFRAVIVDRDAMSSALLADALFRELGCEATKARPSELSRTIETGSAEVVIISADLSSKPGAGLDLAHSVFSAHSEIPIILLLDYPTRDSVINAFRSGARGVFNREKSVAEFIDCVDHVRKGFIWADHEETTYLLEGIRSVPSASAFTDGNFGTLTTRELQVVQSAAKGKGNKAIAAELGLSEHTVKNYLFRAFEKLGVSNRVELLVFLTIRGHSIGPSATDRISVDAAN